ncbi:hypothetical protein ACIPEN_19535 [Herbaspirillum chlorophenolicum]|uniref:DUF4365 domain-containing protein n=1 Tax=Herbaspirillum chlorophenolicum TaxID=211589 RepID=A0ABW8F410_9BURK
MTNNLDFFNRLYQGFEAENLVAGRLYASGLEAFKLPGDFGFDLLVSNQFEQLSANQGGAIAKTRRATFPYVVQVKSRRTDPPQLNDSQRYEVPTDFYISELEFAKIVSNESAFLVCVGFLPAKSGELFSGSVVFWADGEWLKQARGCGFLRPCTINGNLLLKLTLIYRSKAVQLTANVFKKLTDDILAAAKTNLDKTSFATLGAACEKLAQDTTKTLPTYLPVGYATQEYLSMPRPMLDFKNGVALDSTTVIRLPNNQLDLQHLGCATNFGEFDQTGANFIKRWSVEQLVGQDASGSK